MRERPDFVLVFFFIYQLTDNYANTLAENHASTESMQGRVRLVLAVSPLTQQAMRQTLQNAADSSTLNALVRGAALILRR